MSMPAMTAFTQLLHLFSPLRLRPRPRPSVRPRAPKKGHYSGRTTKAKTVTPLTKGDAFNPAYPHKCASFPSPVSVSLRRHAGTRQSTQEINLSISKFTVAEHNKCRERSGRTRTRTWPLARSTLLQVLLFPAFQCAVLADRTKEEEEDGPAPAPAGGQRGSMNPSNQP